jgi:hypothetical protein
MPQDIAPFDFEHYQPRESVAIPTSRRALLRSVLTELHAFSEKVDGKPTLKLADLASLPDEDLARIRPIKAPDCTIRLRDQWVWAQPAGAAGPVALFPVDSPALAAFNLLNGNHDLQQVCQALIDQTHWPAERCWAYTRGLFLKLVSLRVCVPK